MSTANDAVPMRGYKFINVNGVNYIERRAYDEMRALAIGGEGLTHFYYKDAFAACVDDCVQERVRADKVEKRVVALVDVLYGFGNHQFPCLLAQGYEGRPTKDGGYETRYGDKWYQRDDKPPCTCGLDAALAASREAGVKI